MNDLLQKVLTDESARSEITLTQQAAQSAQLGYGWSGDDEVLS